MTTDIVAGVRAGHRQMLYVWHVLGMPWAVASGDEHTQLTTAHRRELFGHGLASDGAAYLADVLPIFPWLSVPSDQEIRVVDDKGQLEGGDWKCTILDGQPGVTWPHTLRTTAADQRQVWGLEGLSGICDERADELIRWAEIDGVAWDAGELDWISGYIGLNHGLTDAIADAARAHKLVWIDNECVSISTTGAVVSRGCYRTRVAPHYPPQYGLSQSMTMVADAPTGGVTNRGYHLFAFPIEADGTISASSLPVMIRHGKIKNRVTRRNGHYEVTCGPWWSWLDATTRQSPPAARLRGFQLAQPSIYDSYNADMSFGAVATGAYLPNNDCIVMIEMRRPIHHAGRGIGGSIYMDSNSKSLWNRTTISPSGGVSTALDDQSDTPQINVAIYDPIQRGVFNPTNSLGEFSQRNVFIDKTTLPTLFEDFRAWLQEVSGEGFSAPDLGYARGTAGKKLVNCYDLFQDTGPRVVSYTTATCGTDEVTEVLCPQVYITGGLAWALGWGWIDGSWTKTVDLQRCAPAMECRAVAASRRDTWAGGEFRWYLTESPWINEEFEQSGWLRRVPAVNGDWTHLIYDVSTVVISHTTMMQTIETAQTIVNLFDAPGNWGEKWRAAYYVSCQGAASQPYVSGNVFDVPHTGLYQDAAKLGLLHIDHAFNVAALLDDCGAMEISIGSSETMIGENFNSPSSLGYFQLATAPTEASSNSLVIKEVPNGTGPTHPIRKSVDEDSGDANWPEKMTHIGWWPQYYPYRDPYPIQVTSYHHGQRADLLFRSALGDNQTDMGGWPIPGYLGATVVPDACGDVCTGDTLIETINWQEMRHALDMSAVWGWQWCLIGAGKEWKIGSLLAGACRIAGVCPRWYYDATRRHWRMGFRRAGLVNVSRALIGGRSLVEANINLREFAAVESSPTRIVTGLDAKLNYSATDFKPKREFKVRDDSAYGRAGGALSVIEADCPVAYTDAHDLFAIESLTRYLASVVCLYRRPRAGLSINVAPSKLFDLGVGDEVLYSDAAASNPWTGAPRLVNAPAHVTEIKDATWARNGGELQVSLRLASGGEYGWAPAVRLTTWSVNGDGSVLTASAWDDDAFGGATVFGGDEAWLLDCLSWSASAPTPTARGCTCGAYSVSLIEENSVTPWFAQNLRVSLTGTPATAIVLTGAAGTFDDAPSTGTLVVRYSDWDHADLQPCQRYWVFYADDDGLLIDSSGAVTQARRLS